MKKLRKVFAVIVSLAMVLGLSMTAFAAPALSQVPKGEVKVYNVNEKSEVIAYQIVRYDTAGSYVKADGTKPADLKAPTADEIKAIAKAIAATADNKGVTPDKADALYFQKKVLTPNGTSYTGDVDAGMWVVLVKSGGSKIYNPMIVSANVTADGTVQGGEVDADGSFKEGASSTIELYAKSDEANVTKSVADDDKAYEIGDDIHFTVTADVPEYSSSYREVVYQLSDTLQGGLIFNEESVEVKVNGKTYTKNQPEFTNAGTTMTIQIDSATVLDPQNQGEGKVVVTYTAKLTEDAKEALAANVNPTTNKVELEYTNNPSNKDDKTKKDDETFHYTFGIDASVFGQNSEIHKNFIKTEEGTIEEVDGVETKKPGAPLAGAQFEILRKNENNEYVRVSGIRGVDADGNTTTDGTTFSDKDGLTKFVGLDANVEYFLREIAAPVGYSKVDTIVPVKVTAQFEENGKLKDGWSITVGDKALDTDETNVYTWNNDGTATVVPPTENPYYFENTTLASLPSTGGIGTTIFTIGGCIIMVAAAGLFFASRRKSSK
ncbi:MAG: isopeptide-forming domain-containing fimbrial protein [Dorea sp.]|nr:isopeptide-forming domain-containing fimbrial protein [Dorea sp.]